MVAPSHEVTTVVITRDREEDLLASLQHHDGSVVVVDNGSRDGTVTAVRRLRRPDVRVVALSRNLGATARDVGVRVARTPLVAFADDDSWWAPGSLDHATGLFRRHPRLGLLAAQVRLEPSGEPDPVCAVMAAAPLGRAGDLPGPDVLGFVACGSVVRRRAFLECGGFDPVVFFCGEEERLALDLARKGWGLAYVDDVLAHHRPASRRDPRDRRAALTTRNHLLTAVMRRPWTVVGGRAWDALRGSGPQRLGLVSAVAKVPVALGYRCPVPVALEQRLRRLEHQGPGEP